MKLPYTILLLLMLLWPEAAGAQPVLQRATPAQVTAGSDNSRYVTPYAIASSGISSNGIAAAGATNIVNGMRTQAGFSIGGNAATATLATNDPGGRKLISLAITNAVTITLSPKGIANGLSTITNDGAMFGPDTPGTVTSGLQEVFNSMPFVNNAGPTAAGIEINLADGYYYFTNVLVCSNYFPRAITIRGKNLLSTKLVYTGTGAGVDCIRFRGPATPRPSSLTISVQLTITDLGCSALRDETNILVRIGDYSHVNLTRCNFTSWQIMTNQVEGAGVSTDSASVVGMTSANLVGLYLSTALEHATQLQDIFFAGLATGIDARNDHISSYGLRFAHIGIWPSKWAPSVRYSLGACILREGGLDDLWSYCHFYSAKAGFILLNEAYCSPILHHANFEACTTPAGSLAQNDHTPILSYPIAYGLGAWTTSGIKVFAVSNSPNYGIITSLVHSNGVAAGVDTYLASKGFSDWQVMVGNTVRFLVDNLGAKVEKRIDVISGGSVTTVDAALGTTISDGVNFSSFLPDGSAQMASGSAGVTAFGEVQAKSLTVWDGTNPKFSFRWDTDSLTMDDRVNDFQGIAIYNSTTGVFGFGDITVTSVTGGSFSGDGHGLTNLNLNIFTNGVTVTPNRSIYLTNVDGKVYRLSAQLIN